MHKTILLSLLLACGTAQAADPAPQDAIVILQHTSVTAWDFGIARLNAEWADWFSRSLEMQGFGPHDIFPVIDSLWILVKPTDDNNGIRISVHLGLNQNRKRRTKGEFQRDAIKIIDLIREQLHIKETQRSSFYPGIAYYFLPIHEQNSPKVQLVRDQIENITKIEIESYDKELKSVGTCTAPLSAKEFTCKE